MRLPSGVPGFDEMVEGGLPAGACVVLQGPPGREKLRFALTFLAEGLKSGAAGLIVVSSNSPDSILTELRSLGVDLDRPVELAGAAPLDGPREPHEGPEPHVRGARLGALPGHRADFRPVRKHPRVASPQDPEEGRCGAFRQEDRGNIDLVGLQGGLELRVREGHEEDGPGAREVACLRHP